MATKMGQMCAPGVLLAIEDNSAYGTIVNPAAIGGIVGYSPKGELNKIIDISNSGSLDAILGYGYNNSKYNQGLYAARAVIDNGGIVEFVRPYGEEIDKSSPYKRDLKSDAFVVTYDRNAFRYDGVTLAKNSFQMKHFAATRFKTDGAAEFGVTRKVNNIAETVNTGKNVNFLVSAGEEFTDSKACRKYSSTKTPTDTVLFSIINSDPSSANRAYESYDVIEVDTNVTSGVMTLTLGSKPSFAVGETLFFPVSESGSSREFGEGVVTKIDEYEVTVSLSDTTYLTNMNRPTVVFYCSDSSAVADGYDYLTVKTAVAGRGVKTFTVMGAANFAKGEENQATPGAQRYTPETSVQSGACILVNDANNGAVPIRILNSYKAQIGTQVKFKTSLDDGTALPDGVFYMEGVDNGVTLFPGDVIAVKYAEPGSGASEQYGVTTVTVQDATKFTVIPNDDIGDLTTITPVTVYFSEFSSKVESVVADISDATSWGDVAKIIAKAFRNSAIGYRNSAVVNDIVSIDVAKATLKLDPSASMEYGIGNTVAIVLGSGNTEVEDSTKMQEFINKYENPVIGTATITNINGMTGEITLNAIPDGITGEEVASFFQLIDLTGAAMDVYASAHTVSTVLTSSTADTGAWVEAVEGVSSKVRLAADSELANSLAVGDVLSISDGEGSGIDPDPQKFTVIEVDTVGDYKYVVVKDPNGDLLNSESVYVTTFTKTADLGQLFVVGAYSMYVPTANQNSAQFTTSEGADYLAKEDGVFIRTADDELIKVGEGDHFRVGPGMGKNQYIVQKSSKCLASTEIGQTFLSLGLATTKYEDVEFNGNPKQVYALTADGENVARLFLAVQYRFNGTLYEFEGTVVPYVLNGQTQLSIEYAAGFELADTGVSFLLNESGILDAFLDNNSYDLSQTIYNGVLDGSTTCISFNPDDPAIVNDAVWTYEPANNMSTSTLTTVWNLFLDKDGSDVSFLVAAGTNINNFGAKNIETLNTQVMSAILTVCEARKDCFALFGGIGEAEIAKALTKYNGATTFPTTLGRWGALYDGKGRVFDSIYTHNVVDIDKSVQIAALVTANRSGSIFWYPPAGKKKGGIPSAWGTSEKYPRRYSYPEDTSSDIAKLINIHVNPTRCITKGGKTGNYFWGDWTLQMEDTAFNQIHVAMLVAGIHKMYYHYLDNYVFDLNTPEVRSDIQATIQASLDSIKNARPSGFYMAECICNETNNPQSVIDAGKLNVWLRIRPTKTARWIQLKTELVKTETGNEVTTTMI